MVLTVLAHPATVGQIAQHTPVSQFYTIQQMYVLNMVLVMNQIFVLAIQASKGLSVLNQSNASEWSWLTRPLYAPVMEYVSQTITANVSNHIVVLIVLSLLAMARTLQVFLSVLEKASVLHMILAIAVQDILETYVTRRYALD